MAQTGNKKINSVAKPGKIIKNNIVEKLNWYSHFEKTIFPKRNKVIRTKLGVKVKILPYKIISKNSIISLISLENMRKRNLRSMEITPKIGKPKFIRIVLTSSLRIP